MTSTSYQTEASRPSGCEATHQYLQAISDSTGTARRLDRTPSPFKRYPSDRRLVLPWTPRGRDGGTNAPAFTQLGTLLRGMLGLRTMWAHPTDKRGLPTVGAPTLGLRRPVPSGGARYPIEAYIGIGPTPRRSGGLYHYDAAHHCLDLIRVGDHRKALVELVPQGPRELPDLILVLAAVFWRTGAKYGDFAYRLQCQETGALAAQGFALAETLNLAAMVRLYFADRDINSLLGLNPNREGALAMLTFTDRRNIAGNHDRKAAGMPTFAELITTPAAQPADPPPDVTKLLPHLHALHTAASHVPDLDSRIPTSREPRHPQYTRHRRRAGISLPPASRIRLADGIPDRTSAPIGYIPTPLKLESLATVLAEAAAGYPSELSETADTPTTIDLYVLALRVTGLRPGAYKYLMADHELQPVGNPTTINHLAYSLAPNTGVGLAGASVVLVPVGDPLATTSWADRRFRLQQIETGLTTHRAALAAAALGLASRIHSDGTNDTIDTALGLGAKRARSLSFLLIGHGRGGHTLLARLANAQKNIGMGVA